jgi:hypothetical protein
MRSNAIHAVVAGIVVVATGMYAERRSSGSAIAPKNEVTSAVEKGAKWLVSVQGKDGGWGQDGGETSYIRKGERLESTGNDVANTAVAAIALLHAAEYRAAFQRALDFILLHVEKSPAEGLTVTDLTGTQIQRKLGPFIDTFLTSKLLAEVDGNMGDPRMNARVRQGLQKCVAKIEKNQLKDGSWNVAGGWAPILGTSMASRSLFVAQQKGVAVSETAMDSVTQYTKLQQESEGAPGSGAGVGGGTFSRSGRVSASMGLSASAGVPLYQDAQALEQLSRSDADRKKNAGEIKKITERLANPKYIAGFGSIGGEEFFSYLNISDSLHRTGGRDWEKWNGEMKMKLVRLQNDDGTWAGQHCITGRVAVTSAAILLLRADRDAVLTPASAKGN